MSMKEVHILDGSIPNKHWRESASIPLHFLHALYFAFRACIYIPQIPATFYRMLEALISYPTESLYRRINVLMESICTVLIKKSAYSLRALRSSASPKFPKSVSWTSCSSGTTHFSRMVIIKFSVYRE